MPSLTIKNIPDEVLDALREQARANRRSLNGEVIAVLEAQIGIHAKRAAALQRIRELNEELRGQGFVPPAGDEVVRMIRETRDRR